MALVTCPTSSSSEPCIPTSVHSLQELFPLSVPCFSISLWHPGSGSVSFCSVGWLKVLRDLFLVCGPVNKTVQYSGIFSLCLGRVMVVVWNAGDLLGGNPLELQSNEQN